MLFFIYFFQYPHLVSNADAMLAFWWACWVKMFNITLKVTTTHHTSHAETTRDSNADFEQISDACKISCQQHLVDHSIINFIAKSVRGDVTFFLLWLRSAKADLGLVHETILLCLCQIRVGITPNVSPKGLIHNIIICYLSDNKQTHCIKQIQICVGT